MNTPYAKVFPDRQPNGEVLYVGEVWCDIAGHKGVQLYQHGKLAKRPATMERWLSSWLATKAAANALSLETRLLTPRRPRPRVRRAKPRIV